MSDNDDDDKKSYEVGYGKPPKHTRFGAEHANPRNGKGRPKGRNVTEFSRLSEEAFWSTFHDAMLMPVPIRENGEEFIMPAASALARTMMRDALNGDKHARKEVLRSTEKATKGKDKLANKLRVSFIAYRERNLEALKSPGSLECFNAYHSWYMLKKGLRQIDGEDAWIYEDGEPITDDDWIVFMKQHDIVKKNPHHILQWPVKYAADLELERFESLTREERVLEHFQNFKHRKEMREKEGRSKWSYMVEEPVTDKDWKCFEQYTQDIVNGVKDPAPWPPAHWDDDHED